MAAPGTNWSALPPALLHRVLNALHDDDDEEDDEAAAGGSPAWVQWRLRAREVCCAWADTPLEHLVMWLGDGDPDKFHPSALQLLSRPGLCAQLKGVLFMIITATVGSAWHHVLLSLTAAVAHAAPALERLSYYAYDIPPGASCAALCVMRGFAHLRCLSLGAPDLDDVTQLVQALPQLISLALATPDQGRVRLGPLRGPLPLRRLAVWSPGTSWHHHRRTAVDWANLPALESLVIGEVDPITPLQLEHYASRLQELAIGPGVVPPAAAMPVLRRLVCPAAALAEFAGLPAVEEATLLPCVLPMARVAFEALQHMPRLRSLYCVCVVGEEAFERLEDLSAAAQLGRLLPACTITFWWPDQFAMVPWLRTSDLSELAFV